MSELEPSPELPDKTPTREVHLPKRIRNALFAAGLKTVGEVRKMPHEALLALPEFGKASIALLGETLGLPSTAGVRPLLRGNSVKADMRRAALAEPVYK